MCDENAEWRLMVYIGKVFIQHDYKNRRENSVKKFFPSVFVSYRILFNIYCRFLL